jgi:hypothetical protein
MRALPSARGSRALSYAPACAALRPLPKNQETYAGDFATGDILRSLRVGDPPTTTRNASDFADTPKIYADFEYARPRLAG